MQLDYMAETKNYNKKNVEIRTTVNKFSNSFEFNNVSNYNPSATPR